MVNCDVNRWWLAFEFYDFNFDQAPLSYFRKYKHIEVHTEFLKFRVSYMIWNNACFVPLFYHAQHLGFLSFRYFSIKTIVVIFYRCLNQDNNWRAYRRTKGFCFLFVVA